MHWPTWVLDGMLLLVTAIVLAGGVVVTYFLVWHVIKFMYDLDSKEGEEKDK